jgi:hypothetical protein
MPLPKTIKRRPFGDLNAVMRDLDIDADHVFRSAKKSKPGRYGSPVFHMSDFKQWMASRLIGGAGI